MSALFREIGPEPDVTQCYIARESAPNAQRRLHAIRTGWADALCFQHDRVFGPYGFSIQALRNDLMADQDPKANQCTATLEEHR